MELAAQVYAPMDQDGHILYLPEGQRLAPIDSRFEWIDTPVPQQWASLVDFIRQSPAVVERMFSLSEITAKDSDCDRRKMGCVVTDMFLYRQGVGANKRPAELSGVSCTMVGCQSHVTCRATDHAEPTALANVPLETDRDGHILFNTAVPCLDCMKVCRERKVRVFIYTECRPQPQYDRPVMSAITLRNPNMLFLNYRGN